MSEQPDLRLCAYYRGVGICSFGCRGEDGPGCMELGRPDEEDLWYLDWIGLTVDESFRKAASK